jgi:RNA polymerase sigma factor for flagellar operon FliA
MNTSMGIDERSELVRKHLPLIKHVAAKFATHLPPSLDYDDLVSMGMGGLLKALEQYDPSHGAKFETYAVIRIRGAILNHLNALSWVPRSVREKERRLQKGVAQFYEREGRMPGETELTRELGLSEDEMGQLLEEVAPISLLSMDEYMTLDADGERSGEERLEGADQPPEEILEEDENVRVLSEAIAQLPEKERIIVSLYYLEDLNLKESGKVLGVSESRACQLLSRAVTKLRALLGSAAVGKSREVSC